MQINYQYQGKWHVKSMEKAVVVVGRPNDRTEVDIDLSPDTTVSREHAKLWLENGSCWIEDLNSRYGTTINGTPIKKGAHELAEGDEIRIGETTLRMSAT